MRTLISIGIIFFVSFVQAQDQGNGSISTPIEDSTGSGDTVPSLKFGVSSFRNQTLSVSGVSYAVEMGLTQPGLYEATVGLPFLWGDARGKAVQEMGNPSVELGLNTMNFGIIDLWLQGGARFSQPEGLMASRFDTYRTGFDLRFRRGPYYSQMGAGYNFRVQERDPLTDVKNVWDVHLLLGRRLTRHWSVEAGLNWYRSEGVAIRGLNSNSAVLLKSQELSDQTLIVAREADWAGVSPAVRYRLPMGLNLSAALTFPILQSRDNKETEVAFWDSSFPRVSEVTVNTQLGVQF